MYLTNFNEYIRKKWKEFVEDDKYKKYFISNQEEWENKLKEVKLYINNNNKRPSNSSKDNKIKHLAIWIRTQIKNYTKNINIIKNEDIRKQWKEFIEDKKYSKYFNTTISNEGSSSEADDSDNEEEIEEQVKKIIPKTPTKKVVKK